MNFSKNKLKMQPSKELHMIFSISDSANIEAALSMPRLAAYNDLIGSKSTHNAIGAYIWSTELNAALVPLFSMLEVVLRNKISCAATAVFKTNHWYQSVLKNAGNRAWTSEIKRDITITRNFYRKGMSPHDKKTLIVDGVTKNLSSWKSTPEKKVEDAMRNLPRKTLDYLLPALSLGFWVNLFHPDFESTSSTFSLWPQCLPFVFPNDPSAQRSDILTRLKRIQTLRNRVSHSEPAWRIAVPHTPLGIENSFKEINNDIEYLLTAMSPEIAQVMINTGAFKRLHWLTQSKTIMVFSGLTTNDSLDLEECLAFVEEMLTSPTSSSMVTYPDFTAALDITTNSKVVLTLLPHR